MWQMMMLVVMVATITPTTPFSSEPNKSTKATERMTLMTPFRKGLPAVIIECARRIAEEKHRLPHELDEIVDGDDKGDRTRHLQLPAPHRSRR